MANARIARTLSLYVARTFLWSVVSTLGFLLAIVALFDLIELMRRASGRAEIPFGSLIQMTLLKLPFMAMEILPFAVLLGGIAAFWRLTRSSELVVARASGVSAWQFLAAPLVVGVMLGVFAITAVSPVSALMFARADRLDATLLRGQPGVLGLSGGGLWVRQADTAMAGGGTAILHGARIAMEAGTLTLRGVSIFRLNHTDRFVARIEAPLAELRPGEWVLKDASEIGADRVRRPAGQVTMPTELTLTRLQESLAPPDTLSFWSLPGFIETLDASGFSSLRHRLRFQALLAMPLLAGTMVLVAAGFSMRPARRGGVGLMIGAGVAAGFMLFMTSKVVAEFGVSGSVPITLAAWTPTAVGLSLAVAMLLHLEDG